MSTTSFSFNSWRLYTLRYSYTSMGKEQGGSRVAHAENEESAIKESIEHLQVSHFSDFKIWVESVQEYKRG